LKSRSSRKLHTGIGHTFGFLKKDPIGEELTDIPTRTQEPTASFTPAYGEHTESAGVMKNFLCPRQILRPATWLQSGITSRQCSYAKQTRQRCITRCHRSLEQQQLDLDSGKLQQGGHSSLVHYIERRVDCGIALSDSRRAYCSLLCLNRFHLKHRRKQAADPDGI
jgi:hypothetical protein